jgi:hypothetical protein
MTFYVILFLLRPELNNISGPYYSIRRLDRCNNILKPPSLDGEGNSVLPLLKNKISIYIVKGYEEVSPVLQPSSSISHLLGLRRFPAAIIHY